MYELRHCMIASIEPNIKKNNEQNEMIRERTFVRKKAKWLNEKKEQASQYKRSNVKVI